MIVIRKVCYCWRCFGRRAIGKGRWILWVPFVESMWGGDKVGKGTCHAKKGVWTVHNGEEGTVDTVGVDCL